ncbi:MAG: nicotinamide mononucleotide transporter [Bacteroidales bacterium]|nr:nicotinamide mononucleotide transporter [Bacteroidales bacterium]MBN2818338.1 nicotinamide mononucleotide transporter [Bacteroidales bacterium]
MNFFSGNLSSDWFFSVIIWLVKNYIEIIATITGIIYLFYSIREDKRLWIYGLITSALYIYVFLEAGIYADMGINVYYVAVSIYGWIHWTRYSDTRKKEIPVSSASLKQWILILLVIGILFVFIGVFLDKITDSTIPFWDAFTTSASIVATWMLARKIMEHWLIWIVVDSISVFLYIYKGLYPTVFLFIVYTTLAVMGYIQWKKQWLKQKSI